MDSDTEMDYTDSGSEEETVMEDTFLTSAEIQEEMDATISEVQAVLQTSPGVCRILLHKYKWNKEALMDRFYESADTNAFIVAAQVIPERMDVQCSSEDVECDICCDSGDLSGLACNHLACGDCWRAYLTEKVVEGGISEIECMAAGCKLLVEDEKVLAYIADSTVVSTYRRRIVDSYVETNKFLKWCPGKDCGKAVKVNYYEPHPIVCPCGSRFCFTCGTDWHEPVNCRLLKLWEKRCMDDSETFNWIHANTKDCPKCFAAIEKNGGCNRILCQTCKYQFCWMCMRDWDVHGYSPCNSFEDSSKTDARVKSRISLDRYLFYYNRFVGHQKSLKFEEKLKQTVAAKMDQLQNLSMTWVEVQFLLKAIDVLSECRRTMMYTYTFAFYLERDNNALIFESNQKDLEMATEQLSGFLEHELILETSDDLKSLRQKVQDKCRYVEHRLQLLLNHCTEGREQNFWKFNQ